MCRAPPEPLSERGCVEDQPQRLETFENAAAGALSPRTQPRSGSGVQCAKFLGEFSLHLASSYAKATEDEPPTPQNAEREKRLPPF